MHRFRRPHQYRVTAGQTCLPYRTGDPGRPSLAHLQAAVGCAALAGAARRGTTARLRGLHRRRPARGHCGGDGGGRRRVLLARPARDRGPDPLRRAATPPRTPGEPSGASAKRRAGWSCVAADIHITSWPKSWRQRARSDRLRSLSRHALGRISPPPASAPADWKRRSRRRPPSAVHRHIGGLAGRGTPSNPSTRAKSPADQPWSNPVRRGVGLSGSPSGLPLLCLGGRDVVVEAEEVVRVVASLDLPQPLEVGISVGRAHAFDGLVGSSVVKVAAAARGARRPCAAPRRCGRRHRPRPPRWPLRSR